MEDKEIRKRMIGVSVFIMLFFTLAIGTIMKLGSGKVNWHILVTLFCIISFFSILIGIVGYRFHKTNPKASKKINNPEVKKAMHTANIYLGAGEIFISIIFYFSNPGRESLIFSLGIFIFGVLTIIFGKWNLSRIKKGKTHI